MLYPGYLYSNSWAFYFAITRAGKSPWPSHGGLVTSEKIWFNSGKIWKMEFFEQWKYLSQEK